MEKRKSSPSCETMQTRRCEERVLNANFTMVIFPMNTLLVLVHEFEDIVEIFFNVHPPFV